MTANNVRQNRFAKDSANTTTVTPVPSPSISHPAAQSQQSGLATGKYEHFIEIGANEYKFNRTVVSPEDLKKGKVKPHRLNPRLRLLLNKYSLYPLIQQMRDNDQQKPIVAILSDGVYWAIDGTRRTSAAIFAEDLSLKVEYTTDDVLESDIKTYIEATDSKESWSAFERVVQMEAAYKELESQWRDGVDNSGVFQDKDFIEHWNSTHEKKLAKSSLSKNKKIWTHLKEDFFKSGNANRFDFNQLYKLATFVDKSKGRGLGKYIFDVSQKTFEELYSLELGSGEERVEVNLQWDYAKFESTFKQNLNAHLSSEDGKKGSDDSPSIGKRAGKDIEFKATRSTFTAKIPGTVSEDFMMKLKKLISEELDDVEIDTK
ncbi:TPA: hypothetical protein I7730_20515 [Vibrio vulnificus]|uniref:ParB/Sulfiredoxin domain-containing protein n=1 Tax=Vibrio vulnificus TaxID=672 RepID=A0A8H9N3M0_VIBVL|nr:ParB N-terminal domain-containing protein [Vibrio vulnificus]HAS8542176.1 hypothetical protein [Vibrio vulnificus]